MDTKLLNLIQKGLHIGDLILRELHIANMIALEQAIKAPNQNAAYFERINSYNDSLKQIKEERDWLN